MPRRLRWLIRVPPGREEEVVAELWERGTLGVESRDGQGVVELVAWFDREPEPLPVGLGGRVLEAGWIEDEDWLAVYRASTRPIEVGRGFLVDPREPDEAPETAGGGRRLLRIPARTAFGTGSHETTRLVVGWLEDLPVMGASVLDVGSGSGIVGFAAEMLGAGRVVGVELDPAAALMSGRFRRLNGLERALLVAGTQGALATALDFDLVVVNVLPDVIRPEIPALSRRVAPGGAVLVAGHLASEAAEVVARWGREGLEPDAVRREGEWEAALLRR